MLAFAVVGSHEFVATITDNYDIHYFDTTKH